MLDYMEDVADLAQLSGARFRGRIGHRALAAELQSSSVLLYPTRFDEISCLALIESQAAGCIPVASRTAALPEGCSPYGILVQPEDSGAFVSAVIDLLRSDPASLEGRRRAMSDWALSKYNIGDLAASWISEFDR
jgi:glycosyltransferase involved in cell wall biosynthesis